MPLLGVIIFCIVICGCTFSFVVIISGQWLRFESLEEFQVGRIESFLEVRIPSCMFRQFLYSFGNVGVGPSVHNLVDFIVKHGLLDLTTEFLGFST